MIRRIFERVIWVAAVTIIAIVLAGSIAFVHIQSLGEASAWLDRSERARFSLQRTLSSVQNAESAVRAYYITREDAFLAPYSEARAQLDAELQSLAAQLADSPAQLARLRSLDYLTHARLDALDQTVIAIRAGTFVLPKAPVAATYTKQLMDSIRSLVNTMQVQESGQLAARAALESRAHRAALVSVVSMSAIAATLVGLLVLVSRRASSDIRRSEQSAKQVLQASEERLRLALEGAELGAVDHDLRTNQAVWNNRLYAIVGYPPGTPVTTGMINLHTSAEDWPQVREALRHARATHVPFRSEHRIVRASDQAVRWVSSNGTFIYDQEGRAIRFIGVVRDVTESHRLESQVRQSQKLDALGTLAGGIAHDFNNILAVLRGNLSSLRAELADDHTAMPAVLDMENACNRATALVRQILTFGRHQEQDRQVLQLEELLREAIQLLRATLPAEIDIRAHYGAKLPAVLVDANQIQQVITNLGINSAHAIGRRPGVIDIQLDTVHIEGEWAAALDVHEGQYVRVLFSDDGCGMSREILERIFEPFFTTKAPNEGTGLGLSVVRGILKNHDAAVSVYSELGRGTCFHLFFPAVQDKAQAVTRVTSKSRRGRGEHVLYLDDEESLVVLAKRMLERMGYRVSGFSDSNEALAAFAAAPNDYDLVLTDLSMPGMSGMEVSQRVLKIRPDIPVLLATGYVRKEDLEQARRIGIRQVIWKPQTVAEMSDLLAQELEKLIATEVLK